MPWRSRVVSWLGLTAIFVTAVWSARVTFDRCAPWPPGSPWCPQDMVIYQWAADLWSRGTSPWNLVPGTMLGQCQVRGPFLYPSWTLPPIHALLGPLTLPEHASVVVTVLAAATAAQLVAWGVWARVNPILTAAALAATTRAGDRFTLGVYPGNLEPMIALVLTVGALAWTRGHRRAGPALVVLAAAVKPDHAPWLLATAWAVGEARRGVALLAALVAFIAVTEPVLLGHDAFGWTTEVLQRAVHDEETSGSTLSLLRQLLGADAGAALWVVVASGVVALVVRFGRRLEPGSATRLLMAWFAVLLVLPRVKDYLWITAYGPVLAACWIQPWAIVALPIGEAVRLVWPQYGVWAEAVVALGVLLATAQKPRQLGASLASGGDGSSQGSPQPGTFEQPPAVS